MLSTQLYESGRSQSECLPKIRHRRSSHNKISPVASFVDDEGVSDVSLVPLVRLLRALCPTTKSSHHSVVLTSRVLLLLEVKREAHYLR